MKERILNLLASGIKAADIASIVGCSPSYVSQLLSQEDFKEALKAQIVENNKEKTEDDHIATRYQNLEHKIITGIENSIAGAELPALTRALEVITKTQIEKQKLKNPALINQNNGGTGNIFITQIALPSHISPSSLPPSSLSPSAGNGNNNVVEMNEKSEIIAIENKPLAPMSSTGVKGIFEALKAKKLALQDPMNNGKELSNS